MPSAELHLAGQKTGAPTLEDLIRLFENLTGRPPTDQEIAEARTEYDLGMRAASVDLGHREDYPGGLYPAEAARNLSVRSMTAEEQATARAVLRDDPERVALAMMRGIGALGEHTVYVRTEDGTKVTFEIPETHGTNLQISFTRAGDTLRSHLDKFYLNTANQGHGIAARVLRDTVQEQQRLGVGYVGVVGVDAGSYAWPRMGFEDANPSRSASIIGFQVDEAVKAGRLTRGEAQAARDVIAANKTSPTLTRTVAALRNGPKNVGKVILSNGAFEGGLNLKDPQAVAYFNRYIAGKRLDNALHEGVTSLGHRDRYRGGKYPGEVEAAAWQTDVGGEHFRTKEDGDEFVVRPMDDLNDRVTTTFEDDAKAVLNGKTAHQVAYDALKALPGDVDVMVAPGLRQVGLFASSPGVEEWAVTFKRDDANNLIVHHDAMFLSSDLQGHGVATNVLRDSLDTYKKMGVSEIRGEAQEMGGYAWGRMGFQAQKPGQLARQVISRAKDLPDHQRKAVTEVVDRYRNDPNLPKHVARLRDGDVNIGRAVMENTEWDFTLPLKDEAAVAAFEGYLNKPRPKKIAASRWHLGDRAKYVGNKYPGEVKWDERSYGGLVVSATRKNDGKTLRVTMQERHPDRFDGPTEEYANRVLGQPVGMVALGASQALPGDVTVGVDAGHNIENDQQYVTVKANAGNGAVEYDRTFRRQPDGRLTVHLDGFYVTDETLQGHGIGTAVLRDSMDEYKTMGVSSMGLAAEKIGAYTWGRMGVRATEPERLAAKVERRLNALKVSDEARKAIANVIEQHRADPTLPSKVAALRSGGRNLGKELLIGNSWVGVLRLDDKEAMREFDRYTAPKHGSRIAASARYSFGHRHLYPKNQYPNEAEHASRTRIPRGPGMPDGAEKTARMKELRVPPAWTDVWVNDDPTAELQATGRDAKGRPQYRYSAEHTKAADAEKFARLKDFTKALPALRERVEADMADPDIPEVERDSAAVTYLIDKTAIRIGSTRDTKADKQAYGATTLENRHVKVDGDKVTLSFTAKKGVAMRKTVTDAKLARMIEDRQSLDRKERLFKTTDNDVRKYISSRAEGFSPKDFRTYQGTSAALRLVKGMKAPTTAKAYKAAQKKVATAVSKHLGNTPAVALKSYIAPSVFSPWKAAA